MRPPAGGPGPIGGGQRPGGGPGALGDRPGGPGITQRPGEGTLAGGPGLGDRAKVGDMTKVGDRTRIGDTTKVGDMTKVGDRTRIGDTTKVGDMTKVGDRTRIGDTTKVGDMTKVGGGDRTTIGGDRTNIGGRGDTTNINVGDVNVGNRASYEENRQAWVSERQNWGNDVRGSVGNRYNNVFNDNWYRQPNAGGYNYYGGWANRGANYAWSTATWAGMGAFFGATLANAQPVYYGYGTGGNVYYENNVVYVNGQAAGSPEQYYQQTQAIAAAAPPVDQVNAQEEWMPLGVYAVTSEDTPDASGLIQLAVDKQGVLAGTYYNEDTQASRPVQGMVDTKTQRAVLTFGDGQNTDLVLETGAYNLTQEEAPALLHFGAEQSQPILLVRLQPPAEGAPAQ